MWRCGAIAVVVALVVVASSFDEVDQDSVAAQSQSEGAEPAPTPNAGDSSARIVWNLDADTAGDLPAGALAFSGSWAIRTEDDAPSPPNALCQTGQAEYPALDLGETVYTDLLLSTQFKPISGQKDRAAGLIFRIQDEANYYILRANALENNVNLYKYVAGRRRTLKEGSARVPAAQWQELRAEVVGNQLRGFLNGQQVVEATDDTFQAGAIGLWTKADSETCFDDIAVQPI